MERLILLLVVSAACIYFQPIQGKIIQISMMKSGTHLLIPLIKKLTKKKDAFITPYMNFTARKKQPDVINVSPHDFHTFRSLSEKQFWITHCPYVQRYATILEQPKYQILYMYRDPRDVVVSLALYIHDKDKQWWPKAQKLSLKETIAHLIKGGESLHVTDHHISKYGIAKVYAAYMPWATLYNTLAIRFEDLIGPKGGGDLKKQIQIIQAIAHHVGKDISALEALELAESLFDPNAFSFNKGQIGSWKEYFTQEQKDLFKQCAGQLLIDLGYEQDLEW